MRVILDGVEVAGEDFVANNGGDAVITAHYSANGTNMKGHLRNLRVYNGAVGALPAEARGFGELKALYRR